MKVPEAPVEGNGTKFPDLMDEAALLEWAGISLGKGDTYRLYLSIKALAETIPGESDRARFFGKITTRGKPYYIVETLSTFEGEEVDPTKQEGKEGANKFNYYVTQSLEITGGWTKLPEVTMAQIQAWLDIDSQRNFFTFCRTFWTISTIRFPAFTTCNTTIISNLYILYKSWCKLLLS